MDELTLLRSTRDETREPSRDARERGRAALFARIHSATPVARFARPDDDTAFTPMKARRRRRTVAWAGFSALGAACVTVALVATDVLGIAGWNGGADPAAASMLHSAAAATVKVNDPVVGPGHYLFIRTDGVFGIVGTLEEDAERIRESGGDIQPSDDVSALEKVHDELYVPADRSDDWVSIRCTPTPFRTFGPRSEAFAEEQAAISDEYDPDAIRRYPGGTTFSGVTIGGYHDGLHSRDDYDALPRDPRRLLDVIHELNGNSGPSRDGQALQWIIDALRGGTAPADFRAALYQAAANIPGVEVTDNQATLNGTTGIAIGRVEVASRIRHDMIIDPATGQFIGERQVTLDGYASFPAGTTTSWTTVTTTVTASAPTGVATCGGG